MASKEVKISLKGGDAQLRSYLGRYQAEFIQESSTDKGHVYWSAPVTMWILVMRKGDNAIITFHHKDNCPCKLL
jgi:hypothetical protein